MRCRLLFILLALFLTSCSTLHRVNAPTGRSISNPNGDSRVDAGGRAFSTERLLRGSVAHFAFDSSQILAENKPELLAQSQYLIRHPSARVLLAGHTDEIGSREYNIALGERRANSVASYLRFSGVKLNQIRVISYGREKPIAMGHNKAAYQENRRVELTYEAY